MRRIEYIIIHCSDSAWGEIDEIRRWHIQRGFDDIGYHYLICNRYPAYGQFKDNRPDPLSDGKVQMGRPEEIVGAHTAGKNSRSIGIALVGTTRFTSAQFESLKCLLKELLEKYKLSIDDIRGHYEFDSSKTCPNFGMDGFRREMHDYFNSRCTGRAKLPLP
jgi:hypothetical protein